jgi:dGTPase
MKRAKGLEQENTAVYATKSAKSRGRLYDASQSPTRSEFQRDRDRIIHSTAFRRLQYKTQVFIHHEGQHFRTRLTHTLEVSQIARSIARALQLNEDLAEAVALAHDLGHTPFGHAGERVLNDRLAQWGGFDHNVQALRFVTLLENRYATHDGLNLTWEALEGILKHNGPLIDAKGNPVGKYASEGLPAGLDELALPGDLEIHTHAGLEAQAAAIADDIAYNSHDIDDAMRAGLLHLPDMADVPLVGPIVREVLEAWPDLIPQRQTHEVQRRLITRTIEDVIRTSSERIAARAPQSVEEARNAGETLVGFSADTAEKERALKEFLYANVYRAEPVMVHVRQGEAIVGDLFDHFVAGGDMPGHWGVEAKSASSEQARMRIIADFVAGMTDPYASDLHARLFDAQP